MLILYNLFIQLYAFAIRLASLWNRKAAALIQGREAVMETLQNALSATDRVIWVHCSSAGEFEQGKPVIEALKKFYPSKKILVSFFSPSGYQVAKNYAFADAITYLPLDTKAKAEQFFKAVKPQLVIFIKYDFWYHHLSTAAFHHVPILLISAVFRKEQVFFKAYGGFFRQMLYFFRHLFVQDNESLQLLQSAGISHCSVSGDTRFDRVLKITENTTAIPFIDAFVGNKKVIVAGSAWSGDEEVLAAYVKQHDDVKLILAPHEVNEPHIKSVQTLFNNSILYSSLSDESKAMEALATVQTLIIDSVGFLSRLYRYATITYVGGGFTKDGIHNILEAAVWAKPVLFGPNYKKYREGREMIEAGGAYTFSTDADLKKIADDLLTNEEHLLKVSLKAKAYIHNNTGATAAIMKTIQEKRLLTN